MAEKKDGGKIPVIDFSRFLVGSVEQQQEVADEIRAALAKVGFFLLRNHGIPESVIQAGFDMSKAFYHRPLEEKMRFVKSSSIGTGFLAHGKETLHGKVADNKEMFDLGLATYLQKIADGTLPEQFQGKPFLELATCLRNASRNMLRAIAMSLHVDDNEVLARFHEPLDNQHLRFPYYPPQDPDSVGVACGPHTDFLTLTMGFQDAVGGLEAWDTVNDEWMPVPAGNYDMIVNLGDPLQRWSNDELLATMHRVMPVKTERFSFFLFSGPKPDQVVDPRDLGFENPKWEPSTFLDLLLARADSSVQKVEERDVGIEKLYGKNNALKNHEKYLEEQKEALAKN